MKLCIGGYLNLSIVFLLETTAYHTFFPCPIVLSYTTRAVVYNQQVYSNSVENVHFMGKIFNGWFPARRICKVSDP